MPDPSWLTLRLRRQILGWIWLPVVAVAPAACDRDAEPVRAVAEVPQPESPASCTIDDLRCHTRPGDDVDADNLARDIRNQWCASPDRAALVAKDTTSTAYDCPIDLDPELFELFVDASEFPRGAYPSHLTLHFDTTKRYRDEGLRSVCCYHERYGHGSFGHVVIGRPMLVEGQAARAEVRAQADWATRAEDRVCADDASGDELSAQQRERLAALWLQDGLEEHAAVAAFGRAALELMALGAPPELLEGCHRAALQEIAHARSCFALATHFSGQAQAPGQMPVEGPRDDLASIARDTLLGGCVGESIAAYWAALALQRCSSAVVADHLRAIAQDEAHHAALAWSVLRWACQLGGDRLKVELLAVLEDLDVASMVAPDAVEAGDLGAWGRLDLATRRRAAEVAFAEVVMPIAREMLGPWRA